MGKVANESNLETNEGQYTATQLPLDVAYQSQRVAAIRVGSERGLE